MIFSESLGFYGGGFAALFETFKRLCEHGEVVEAGGFQYLKWVVDERLELWTQIKDGKPGVIFSSYYAGETRMKVALLEKTPRRESLLSDGAFLCRGCGFAGENFVGGRNPFIFDTIDYHRYDALEIPRVATVQLTAFAFKMTGYEDEDAYDDDYPADANGFCWDYQHFIPYLMYDKERGEGGELQSANTEVSGRVKDTAIITNPLTGLDFCWARIETIGGEVDAVCSPDKLDGFLVKDGIAVVRSYLFGRPAEDVCN